MKKVLGISFGRKLQTTDVMVKEALLQCKQAGHEITFIRAQDLDIKNCTGCIACVIGLNSGRTKGECVLKDDFHILDEAIMEADAVIYGCPTYETSPTGLFKTVCDRIGPSHDLAFRKVATDERQAAGRPQSELPDPRALKPRVGAFCSCGGALTKNWLAFMSPVMYEFSFPLGIDIVDTFDYHGGMAYNHVVGNTSVIERMARMGQNVVEALAATDEAERTRWRGEHQGVCPVCHCNLLTIPESGEAGKIECPVCGIEGSVTLEDGRLKTAFSAEQQDRSRLRYGGKLEHCIEIREKGAPPGQIPDLEQRLDRYRWE
ncbi:flavodoxin family protein [Ruminococcaceae bacterium OttesenSCG-928-D13]|nr:flavodoxin family protein [Ruminococcaceae bacterium OttesenSCG-928-D13]